jgi:histone H3/H4
VLKKAQVSAEARQLSEEAIQDHLKAVYQKYYKVKGSARELCQTALESLAEAIASAGNLSQESALKAARKGETAEYSKKA